MSSFYVQTQSRSQEKSRLGTCPSPHSPPPLPGPRDAVRSLCPFFVRGIGRYGGYGQVWQGGGGWQSLPGRFGFSQPLLSPDLKMGLQVCDWEWPPCPSLPAGLSLCRFLCLSFTRAIRRLANRRAALQQPLLPHRLTQHLPSGSWDRRLHPTVQSRSHLPCVLPAVQFVRSFYS